MLHQPHKINPSRPQHQAYNDKPALQEPLLKFLPNEPVCEAIAPPHH